MSNSLIQRVFFVSAATYQKAFEGKELSFADGAHKQQKLCLCNSRTSAVRRSVAWRYTPADSRRKRIGPGNGRALRATLLGAPVIATVLNEATPAALRTLVWLDFELAVPLFVVAPLGIFFASFTQDDAHEALRRLMVGYWQASSMLMLTVFFNIAQQPIGFLTALVAQVMIPISLFWWRDLEEEIRVSATQGRSLERLFLLWKPLATILALAGAVTQLSTLRCLTIAPNELLSDPQCAAWLEPPFDFYNVHVGMLLQGALTRDSFGAIAYAGLAVYVGYTVYMITRVLPRVGRRGRASRKGLFTSVGLLSSLGWIRDKEELA